VIDVTEQFRMGELFCGPGGMALGARRAALASGVDLQHIWANDYDLDTCHTYRRNILEPAYGEAARLVSRSSDAPAGASTIIHQNVHELDIDALRPIDGFAFGFPCNDYSLVGEWRGLDGEFGPLYTYGVEVLATKRPKWFVAENVSGLRGANEGRAFRQILEHLEEPASDLSYRLVPHLYSFDEYGVPQRRRRIVIVGVRADLDVEFRVPAPTTNPDDVTVSSRYALSNPPLRSNAPNHEYVRQSKNVAERLSYIRPGENAFSPPALVRMPRRLHINTRATLSQVYRRLDPDRPAYTVTGGGGGGTYVYHWDENRALTNRERARLQTFPDNFIFEGGLASVRKQIGMAVPVRGAEQIFRALFTAFRGEDYPSIASNLMSEVARD
jgi:DNA (cytosine-5)-methyltransferase 1